MPTLHPKQIPGERFLEEPMSSHAANLVCNLPTASSTSVCQVASLSEVPIGILIDFKRTSVLCVGEQLFNGEPKS